MWFASGVKKGIPRGFEPGQSVPDHSDKTVGFFRENGYNIWKQDLFDGP